MITIYNQRNCKHVWLLILGTYTVIILCISIFTETCLTHVHKKNFTTLNIGYLPSFLLSLTLINIGNLDDLFVNVFLLFFFSTNIGSLTDSNCIICMNIICRYS